MKEKGSTLHSKAHNITIISGELHRAPNVITEKLTVTEDAIHIYLTSRDMMTTINDIVKEKLKNSKSFYYKLITYDFNSFFNRLISALLILVFFGILELYGNSLLDVLVNGVDFNQRTEVINLTICILSSLSIFALFSVGPSQFSDISYIRNSLNSFSKSDVKQANRLFRNLRLLSKNRNIRRIVIWNPELYDSKRLNIIRVLISRSLKENIIVVLNVRIDEEMRTRKLLESIIATSSREKKIPEWEINFNKTGDRGKGFFPVSLLDSNERDFLSLCMLCSTSSLGIDLEDTSINNSISIPLVKWINEHFESKIFSNTSQGTINVYSYLSRFINDYNFLEINSISDFGVWRFKSSEILENFEQQSDANLRFIASYLKSDFLNIIEQVKDPVCAVILVDHLKSVEVFNKKKFIQHYSKTIAEYSLSGVFRKSWRGYVLPPLLKDQKNFFRILPQSSSYEILINLLNAGMYQDIIDCLDNIFTNSHNNIEFEIIRFKVFEAQGEYNKSVEGYLDILSNYENLDEYNKKVYYEIMKGIAWSVVSGRLEKHKDLGTNALDAMNPSQLKDLVITPEYWANFYNYQANYNEWFEKLDKAQKSYELGLSISGVGLRTSSSLKVNLGIIYRFRSLEKHERSEQLSFLKKSYEIIEDGVLEKETIGNIDQLPIAIHNFCESTLKYAKLLNTDQDDYYTKITNLYQASYDYSRKALDILHKSKSRRKLEQLLVEHHEASYKLFKMKKLGAELAIDSLNALDALYIDPSDSNRRDLDVSLAIFSDINDRGVKFEDIAEARLLLKSRKGLITEQFYRM